MKKGFGTLFCVLYSIIALVSGVITCPGYDANYIPAKFSLPSEEFLSISTFFTPPRSKEEEEILSKIPEYHASSYDFWLNEVTDWGFLKDETKDKIISREYVLIGDVSFVGTTAINIEIYTDGSGMMRYEFHDFNKDRNTMDRTIALNRSQTKQIDGIFNDNTFWEGEINTYNGLDGDTVMIEGVSHSKYKFLYKWCPEPDDREYRIYYSIKECYNKWK